MTDGRAAGGSRAVGSATALALLVAMVACGSPVSRFYVLRDKIVPETPGTSTAGPAFAGSVVVRRVTLPELLDRPQLVVGDGYDRVAILEEERWAEPLKSGIANVVASQLGRLLGSKRVSSSDEVITHPDWLVSIDVRRFEAEPDRAVTIEALWSAIGGGYHNGHTLVQEAVKGNSYDEIVSAQARALEGVSRKIAEAILSPTPAAAAPKP